MKIIDLLNKIANGEKVPKKIRYGIHTFELWEGNYINYKETSTINGKTKIYKDLYDYIDISKKNLNDEVKIIDEINKLKEK